MSTATQAKNLSLDSIKAEVQERMESLRPAAQEFAEIENVWEALSGNGTTQAADSLSRTTNRRRMAPKARQQAKRGSRRGRPAGSGRRSQEVIALLADKPGQTTTQLAEAMQIKPNYLYRVLPDMVKAGTLAKDGNTFKVA